MLKSFLYRNLTEAGCDEAGRGCLAGPVVAAAVILPKNYKHLILNDSKKLSAKQRALLKDEIINSAIAWKVAFVDNNEIDEMIIQSHVPDVKDKKDNNMALDVLFWTCVVVGTSYVGYRVYRYFISEEITLKIDNKI